MIDCRSSMLSRFINGILRRRPGMLGLDHLTGGTLSSGHRPLVHFQLATGGTFWVATEDFGSKPPHPRSGALPCGNRNRVRHGQIGLSSDVRSPVSRDRSSHVRNRTEAPGSRKRERIR